MKTTKLFLSILLPFWGLVIASCNDSVSKDNSSINEMSIPVWEDTARPVIEGFIRWYEDRTKIPLLKEVNENEFLGLANIVEWGDSLHKCHFLTTHFIDSIIPSIDPHYWGSAMDYGYPISHVPFDLMENYPPDTGEGRNFYRPFNGLDSLMQVTCKIQPDSTLRCTYTLGKEITHDFITWLRKENGRWLIWQWDYCVKCLEK